MQRTLRYLLNRNVVTLLFLYLAAVECFLPSRNGLLKRSEISIVRAEIGDSSSEIAESVFFDIEVEGNPLGRLVFELFHPSPLPLHTQNLKELCRGSRVGFDPKARYKGCMFDYSPDYIEGESRYRWAHVLRGNGRNAVGRANGPLVDSINQLKNTHSCYGGQYYGMKYEIQDENDPGVLLTVQVAGTWSWELSIYDCPRWRVSERMERTFADKQWSHWENGWSRFAGHTSCYGKATDWTSKNTKFRRIITSQHAFPINCYP